MIPLAGKRILIVEDEALVAAMLQDMLIDLGATVVGPAFTIARSLELAREAHIDAAVLDVNVRGERIDPVAAVLRDRRIPVVFATGYNQGPDGASEAPVIDKPYTRERLAEALRLALHRAPA
jgi:CheY-like chemotaxis protein